jgi:hypothetical protein
VTCEITDLLWIYERFAADDDDDEQRNVFKSEILTLVRAIEVVVEELNDLLLRLALSKCGECGGWKERRKNDKTI